MSEQAFKRTGFVMNRELINDSLAGLVETDDFNLGTFATKFQHDHIQRGDAGNIPDMRVRDVDDNVFQRLLKIKKML